MGLQVGDVIQNKYRIVRLLGQGGMGAVFEGENLAIARRVAIKVLHGALASQQGVVERFEREAQAAGRIGNDHILEVLDMGQLPDGDRFMVMEFLDGESLEQRLNRMRRMEPAQLYPIARQLLTGLLAAHAAGIIHRDLKPDNVFILREKAGHPDYVKIIDFGISKFTALGTDMKMTATGAVMGTPYFMSPEQAKGSRDADARSDLYAVGVILFRAITGQVPFDAATFNELLFKIVLSETPKASSIVPTLDPNFDNLILKAMARDASARFQSAREFIAALDNWYSRGTAMAPASSAQGVHAQLPTVADAALAPPGSHRALHNSSPAYSERQSVPSNLRTTPAPVSQPTSPYQATSGLGHPTGYRSNPGITNGSWSNTGYGGANPSRSALVLGAGAGAVVLGIGALGYLFWSNRQAAPTVVDPNEPVAAIHSTFTPSPPAVVAAAPSPVVPSAVLPLPVASLPAPVPPPAAPPAEQDRSTRNDRRRVSPAVPQRPVEVSRPIVNAPPSPPAVVAPPPEAPPPPKPRRPMPSDEDMGY